MENEQYPKLRLPDWFDEDTEYEIRDKGFFEHALVELESGEIYKVCFFDRSRLNQSFEDRLEGGERFLAERGLVIVSEVSLSVIKEALPRLEEQGFFEGLRPETERV